MEDRWNMTVYWSNVMRNEQTDGEKGLKAGGRHGLEMAFPKIQITLFPVMP